MGEKQSSLRVRYFVLDGVLLVQKLLKLFPFDTFCVAHEYNKLAAILQGKLGNAVLPYTKIGSSLWNRQQPLFIERHERTDFLMDVSVLGKEIGSELRSAAKLEAAVDMLMLV